MRFVSDTNVRIDVDPGGHVATLQAGVPKDLHERFHQAATASGCRVADDAADAVAGLSGPSAEDKAAILLGVIEDLVAKGDPSDFKKSGNGSPLIAVVREQSGIEVTQAELNAAWENFDAGE